MRTEQRLECPGFLVLALSLPFSEPQFTHLYNERVEIHSLPYSRTDAPWPPWDTEQPGVPLGAPVQAGLWDRPESWPGRQAWLQARLCLQTLTLAAAAEIFHDTSTAPSSTPLIPCEPGEGKRGTVLHQRTLSQSHGAPVDRASLKREEERAEAPQRKLGRKVEKGRDHGGQ